MTEEAKLWDRGVYLITVEYCGLNASLYSVGKEFIEIYYNPNQNKIEKIREAASDDLKKYLTRIELPI